MADSKLKRFTRQALQLLRSLALAYMLGISNIVNQETRLIEDSFTKIEYREEINDDQPLEELL